MGGRGLGSGRTEEDQAGDVRGHVHRHLRTRAGDDHPGVVRGGPTVHRHVGTGQGPVRHHLGAPRTAREIRGAFTTDPDCKIRPGKPALADLRWVRSPEVPKGGPNPAGGAPANLAWGKTENGLRMGVAVIGPKRLAVVIENVGKDDAVVNLGIMLANGKRQFPTAIKLSHHRPDREDPHLRVAPSRSRRARRSVRRAAARRGAVHARAAAGHVHRRHLQPLAEGRYRITAEFTGEKVTKTNADSGGLALMPYWTGTLRSGEVALDLPAEGSQARSDRARGAREGGRDPLGQGGEGAAGRDRGSRRPDGLPDRGGSSAAGERPQRGQGTGQDPVLVGPAAARPAGGRGRRRQAGHGGGRQPARHAARGAVRDPGCGEACSSRARR